MVWQFFCDITHGRKFQLRQWKHFYYQASSHYITLCLPSLYVFFLYEEYSTISKICACYFSQIYNVSVFFYFELVQTWLNRSFNPFWALIRVRSRLKFDIFWIGLETKSFSDRVRPDFFWKIYDTFRSVGWMVHF